MNTAAFQELVWQKGRELYRDMPWRDEPTFYHVLVSELMLQQTQVSRVLVKFEEFMQEFPTIDALASAELADVLRVWQGLGYNRRAKYLHEAAKRASLLSVPHTLNTLMDLPGVGKNTAAAIMNYTENHPTPFIETNIRTVYFNHFFAGQTDVHDRDILALVEKTMDHEHPREWFWALMDYGAYLKSQGAGQLTTSKHYKKQSPLKGSVREIRGQILRTLSTTRRPITKAQLMKAITVDQRFEPAFTGLLRDGLITQSDGKVHLTK